MRKSSELVQLMLDNFDEHFYTGLCELIATLYEKVILKNAEDFTLNRIIQKYVVENPNTKKC